MTKKEIITLKGHLVEFLKMFDEMNGEIKFTEVRYDTYAFLYLLKILKPSSNTKEENNKVFNDLFDLMYKSC